MAPKGTRLSPIMLARVFCRSFFLQASWNFEGLQSLGVLYALAPALRRLYRDRAEDLASAYQRHLQYFNTHPYMASPILGVMLELEEERSEGCGGNLGVQEFRGMVTGPYAAMGDAFFWGGIRPLAAVAALLFAVQGILWAPLVFLVLFNGPHLWVRLSGLQKGYGQGLAIIETIRRRRFPDVALRLKEGTVVLLGGVSACLVAGALKQEALLPQWGLAALPLMLALGWLARKGISSLTMILTASALLLLFAQTG